jgi:hypothetical protein
VLDEVLRFRRADGEPIPIKPIITIAEQRPRATMAALRHVARI